MKLLNYSYQNEDDLKQYIKINSFFEKPSVLVQLFFSNQSPELMYRIRSEVIEFLPNCSLIATSTAGIIGDGTIIDDQIVLSFSVFDQSDVVSTGYKNQEIDCILDDLAHMAVNEDTKLLVVFANTFRFDSTHFLEALADRFPRCSVAGGNAGDDYKFEKCDVFSKESDDCDVVVASISSKTLEVTTQYLLNWQSIGQEMTVTKARGIEVFEINHKSVLKIYEHYLGHEIAENILECGIEFPLIFQVDDISIARAPIAINKKLGSVSFAGEIPEGSRVRFGYADVEYIEQRSRELLLQQFRFKNEAIYVYSCGSRRQMLGKYLNDELFCIDQIAPTSGFITYGEFFHDRPSGKNSLLNITTTLVTLNEISPLIPLEIHVEQLGKDKKDITLKALTTLITKTSEELDQNIHYLQQFKNAVNEASIFSISNEKGIITEVNKNFEIISGYTRKELLGSPHNIIRHPDMPKEVFEELWKTIKQGETWKGLVKNLSKDKRAYYVITEIFPIFNKDGSFREYMAIRNDVTELEESKLLLKYELDTTSKNLLEEIVNTQKEVILTMGAIGETRSKETGLHVKRVAEYSYLLAKLSGLSENEASLLKQASPMHDIGKVGIPDDILNKPGALTANEFNIMKTHAELGYEMLKSSEREILKTSAVVAYSHHEKWDGSGYPLGLKGENISIYGRITAIADVFDALGHDRVYKKGWALEDILDFFRQEREKHFDPHLIDLFFENLDQFLFIRNQMQDG